MTTPAVVVYEVRTIDDVRIYRGTSEGDARAAFEARAGMQPVALLRVEPLERSAAYVHEDELRGRVVPGWRT